MAKKKETPFSPGFLFFAFCLVVGTIAGIIVIVMKVRPKDSGSPSPTSSVPPTPLLTTVPPISFTNQIANLNPMIFLTPETIPQNAYNLLYEWPSFGTANTKAVSTIQGTFNYPLVMTENNNSFVRLNSISNPATLAPFTSVNGNYLNFGSLTFNSATNNGFTFIGVFRLYNPQVVNFHRVFDFANDKDIGRNSNNIVFSRFSTTNYYCSNYMNGEIRGRIPSPENQIRNSSLWDVVALRFQTNSVYISSLQTGSREYTPTVVASSFSPTLNPNETFQPMSNKTLANTFIGRSVNYPGDNLWPLDIQTFIVFDRGLDISTMENIRQGLISKYSIV